MREGKIGYVKVSHKVLAGSLFFLSGFASLSYEIIWFKRLSLLWGNSSFAASAVVASFLSGLGLGAYIISRKADEVRRPLFVFGMVELFIGILALCVPFQIAAAFKVLSYVYPHLENQGLLSWIIRLALTGFIIGPGCVLMGATFPLISTHLSRCERDGDDAASWVYGLNTLGAATGAVVCGFFLIPSFGLLKSGFSAIGLNALVGSFALYCSFKTWAQPNTTSENTQGILTDRSQLRVLSWASFLIGCGSLIMQMIWNRNLALVLGGSTFAFSSTLFIVLAGIATGSLCFHYSQVLQRLSATTLGILVLGFSVSVWVSARSISVLSPIVGSLLPFRASSSGNSIVSIGISSIPEFIPSALTGILLPLLIHLWRKAGGGFGNGVGRLYGANTLGNLFGALVATFFLIPRLGLERTASIAVCFYIQAAFLLFLTPRLFKTTYVSWTALSFACVFAMSIHKADDPRLTNMGMYMYGVVKTTSFSPPVLYFKEAATCNVLVTGDKDARALRVNGKVDASTKGDMPMQLGLAYLPRFLRPEASNVFVIGYGSGTTAGASLLFPDTKVTCSEIEPAVYGASSIFSDLNHSPHTNHDFRILYEDGRAHLQGTKETYDLILSEPSNPWLAGVCNLFTREFYISAKARMSKTGLLAQWVQTYSFSEESYASVLKTVSSVFRHCGVIRISDGDTIIIASDESVLVGSGSLAYASRLIRDSPEIRSDFRKYFGATDPQSFFKSHYILDSTGIETYLAPFKDAPLITDLNLRLEFDTPLRLFREDTRTGISRKLLESVNFDWTVSCAQSDGAALDRFAEMLVVAGATNAIAGLLNTVAQVDLSGSPLLQALRQGSLGVTLRKEAIGLKRINELGVLLWRAQKFPEAISFYAQAVKDYPSSATLWANMAANYKEQGDKEGCENALQTAELLDSANPLANELRFKFNESGFLTIKDQNR